MTQSANQSSPKIARQLLRLFVPPHLQDAVIGDLEESYHVRMQAGVRLRQANSWYWRETLRASRLLFGSTPPSQQHRPSNGDSVMSIFQSDVRFAMRMLMRRPGFTLLAVATLALGIGATTAIFSAVNPILFESLPYPNADQLTMVWEGNSGSNRSNIGYATFADIQEQNHSFSSMAAMGSGTATMTGKGEPLYLHGQRVSPTFFTVLGVHPSLGRDFRVEENVRGTQRVIVLSNALWRNRFGGDTGVIGKPIVLDGNSVIVIGVMPANFENVISPTSQYWMPLRYDVSLPQACRDCRHLRAIARRRTDVSAARASKDVAEIFARMAAQYPKEYGTTATVFTPRLDEDVVRNVRPALLAVLGAVVLVLLVACLNVMNLLLARGAQRESEFSVRAALGAGRMRIVRQLLAESMLLSIMGGLSGIGVALLGVRILLAVSPANLPRLEAIHVDGQVLAFAIAITTLVAFVFGLIPGLFATRKNLSEGIRRNGQRAVGSSRVTRSALVISEVALASILLAGSGLLFRSMSQLFAVSPGFDTQNLLTMSIQSGAGRIRNDTLITEFYDGALRAVRQQPGVISAALTSQLPLGDEFDAYGVRFEQKPPIDAGTEGADAFRYAVSDKYFETMKIPLRSGRYFSAEDKANAPGVTIISQTFAKKHFGNASPLGQRVQVGGETAKWREIVGVVGDVKQTSLSSDEVNGIYFPEAQWNFVDNAMTMVVRTRGDALQQASELRAAIWSVDKDQPFIRIATSEKLMEDTASGRRFALVLFESFAILALVLAAAGIYGVLSGTVSERIRELGVRAALGATSRDQIAMVLRQGLALTGVGVAVGVVAALVSSRVISGMLFNVSPVDPVTYVGVGAALIAVALLACWIPARRASEASPMEALRAD